MTHETENGDLRCERVRLLLSLQLDGAATAAQEQEIDEHLGACDMCCAVRDVDLAVRQRLATSAAVPDGFATRVAAIARQREARSQNRLLLIGAAAAALIAAVVLIEHSPTPYGADGPVVAQTDTRTRAITAVTAGDLSQRGGLGER